MPRPTATFPPHQPMERNPGHHCMCYCMHMLTHRLQILLDDERHAKVVRVADQRGVSVAAVIREAIDQLLTEPEGRRAAVEAILRAEPMPVPGDPSELRRELDEARERFGA